jgi:chaperonin GroES
MNLRPLADRVIVKRVEQETKTASGIVIPTTPPRSPIRAKSSRSAPASATSAATSSP